MLTLVIVDGATTRQIAAALDMPVDTVKLHMKAITRKLGVANRIAIALHRANNLETTTSR